MAGARAGQATATRSAPAGRAGTDVKPATAPRPAPAAKPGGKGKARTSPAGPAAAPKRGKLNRPVLWAGAGCLVLAAGGVLFVARPSGAPHVLAIPDKIGSYTKEPGLAKKMDAGALQQQIIAQSGGEVKNVVYAVYQDRTGPAAQANPQIILFLGGNLTGSSDSGFIDSFVAQTSGAERVDPGPLGGSAACLPSTPGKVGECVWADNDTFGVIASATLSMTDLANELRTARPQIEHRK